MKESESSQALSRENVENIIPHKDKLFEHIVDNFLNLDEYDRRTVLLRVFEYSADDGFMLADKLNLSGSEIVDVITSPNFVEKHRKLMKSLRHQLSMYSSFVTPSDYENLDKIMDLGEVLNDDDKFDEFSEKIINIRKYKVSARSKPFIDLIDNYYLNFIKSLNPEENIIRGEEPSKIMFDIFMRQFQFATKKFFYTRDVQYKIMDIFSIDKDRLADLLKQKKVSKKIIENIFSEQFLSTEDIEVLSSKLGIDKKALESTRKKPYSEFYYAVKDATKREICDELSQKLELKYGRGRVDILENEKGELCVESKQKMEVDEDGKNNDVQFEIETQDFIEKYIKLESKKIDEVLSKSPVKFEYAFILSLDLYDKYDYFNKLEEVFYVFLDSTNQGDRFSSIKPMKILEIMRKERDLSKEDVGRFIDALSQKGSKDPTSDAVITSVAENNVEKFRELIELKILKENIYSSKIKEIIENIENSQNPKIFFEIFIETLKQKKDQAIFLDNKILDTLIKYDKSILDHLIELELNLDSNSLSSINYFIQNSDDNKAISNLVEKIKDKGDKKYKTFIGAIRKENLIKIHKMVPDMVDFLIESKDNVQYFFDKLLIDHILFKDSIDKLLLFFEKENTRLVTVDYYLLNKDYDEVFDIIKGELDYLQSSDIHWDTIATADYGIDKIGGEDFKNINIKELNLIDDRISKFSYFSESFIKDKITDDLPNNLKELMKDVVLFLSKTKGTDISVKIAVALKDPVLQRELLNTANYQSHGYNRYYSIFNEFILSAVLKDYKYFEEVLNSVVKSNHTNSLEYLTKNILDDCHYDPNIIEIILRVYQNNGYMSSLKYFLDKEGLNKDNMHKSKDIYMLICKYWLLDGLSKDIDGGNYSTKTVIRFAGIMEDIDMLKKIFYILKDKDDYLALADECLNAINKIQNKEKKELNIGESEQSYIDMYRIVNNPTQEDLNKWNAEQSKRGLNKDGGKTLSYFLKKMITESPKTLFGNIVAKTDETSPKKMNLLLIRLFPNILNNKQKIEDNGRGLSGFFDQLFGKNYKLDYLKSPGSSRKNNYLQENSSTLMWGGDPRYAESELSKVEVISTSEDVFTFQASECFLSLDRMGGNWGKIPLKINDNDIIIGNDIEVKIAELRGVQGKIVILKPLLSNVDISSIEAFDRNGAPIIDINIQENIDGTILVNLGKSGDIESLKYKYKTTSSLIDADISSEEFEQFKENLSETLKSNSEKVLESKITLPAEVNLFLESIKDLSPIDKVKEIEKYVREVSYYDFDNGEVNKDKFGRSPVELFTIMQFRMEDIKKKKKELAGQLSGKLFAGVCADFANLTALIFRSASIPSGVSTGFLQNGNKATLADAHGLCVIPWPTKSGEIELIEIDGTPGGVTDEEKEKLKRFRLPDIETRIREKGKNNQELDIRLSERLSNLEKIIQYGDPDIIKRINIKELSSIIDSIFANENGSYHVQMIELVLSAVRYSPLSKLIFSEGKENIEKLKTFIEMQIDIFKKKTSTKAQIGRDFDLIKMIEEYGNAYSKDREVLSKKDAYDLLGKIIDLVGGSMNEFETRAAKLTINYLRVKNQV